MLSLSKFVSNCKNISTEYSADLSTKFKNLSDNAFPACNLCQAEYANCVRENVSKAVSSCK